MSIELASQVEDACTRAEEWLRSLPSRKEHIVVGGGSVASNHGPTLLSEADCVMQFARHLAEAGLPWEDMHFELSRSKWLYASPHPAAELGSRWRVDLAVVDRDVLLAARLPVADDRFRFDVFFELALAGNFCQHGAAYGHPKKVRDKVDADIEKEADIEKVARHVGHDLRRLAYVVVFEECDHGFDPDFAARHSGVILRVLKGWE